MENRYQYVEPDSQMNSVVITISESEILRTYYPYWCSKMIESKKFKDISVSNCLEDFCTVHWATRMEGTNVK